MARRASMKEGEGDGLKRITAAQLKREVEEISRQKGLASEYAGNAGKATQSAVERFGLEKTALTFARRLHDMEEAKRSGVIRASIEYWVKLGFLDQLDMFSDTAEMLSDILKRAHNVQPAKKSADDAAVDEALTS